jgi:hypothetical protein
MQTIEGHMANIYVVKTGEQFLCTGEDGDIGLAPVIEDAMSFCPTTKHSRRRTNTPNRGSKSCPSI